ncbi:MAG: hypothetical protein FIA82_11310 [Melioribacter sp.]|nr:hypothetical protein [Melioribacter sp.]
MKLLKNNSSVVILFSIIVLLILFLNNVLGIYPILDIIKYLETRKYYWIIPTASLLLFGIWLYNDRMRRKVINERIEVFKAIMRTVQDILHNSSSSIQLLIMDMKDEGVHEELIIKAENNMEELRTVIKTLASIDPTTIELKELNKSMSIIKMHK